MDDAPAEVRVAPFTPRYQQAVVELILGIQRDEFGVAITLDDQPDLLNIPGFYQSGRGGFWLALSDERVVGTAALIDIGGGQAALRKMFVAPAYRGKQVGAASALLAELLRHARDQGLREIYLGTIERYIAAMRFYERNGFERVAPEALPATFPRMAVDNRFYRLALAGPSSK
jgi:GNAT superfamily N-acetyltransferase